MAELDPNLPISRDRSTVKRGIRLMDALPALGIALSFSISAIFVRNGLLVFPYPLLGVTIGMFISVAAYGIWLLWLRGHTVFDTPIRSAWYFQALAGVLIGLGTWARYIATDLVEIGVVLALGRINTPLVLLVSPILFGRKQEPVTIKVWLGAGLIIIGSLVILFAE
jgi:uncharacterized membrane protein